MSVQKGDMIYSISYKPLWHLLVERKMGKVELARLIGASTATVTKMSRGGHVALEVVERICVELDCQPGDVLAINKVELIPATKNE